MEGLLKNEMTNYSQQENTIIEILDYIATLGNIENMGHWNKKPIMQSFFES
jgi:hypothetical protein